MFLLLAEAVETSPSPLALADSESCARISASSEYAGLEVSCWARVSSRCVTAAERVWMTSSDFDFGSNFNVEKRDAKSSCDMAGGMLCVMEMGRC